MTKIWKVETISMHIYYQLENIIISIDALFSCTCNFILYNYDMYLLIFTSQKMYLNAYYNIWFFNIMQWSQRTF